MPEHSSIADGSVTEVSTALQFLFTMGSMLPDVRLQSDVDADKEYNEDGVAWRDSFHELARRETASLQYKLERASPHYSQHIAQFVSDRLAPEVELVNATKVRPCQPPPDPVGHYTPVLFNSLAMRIGGKENLMNGDKRQPIQRIHNAFLDIGATLSVIDRATADALAIEADTSVAYWKRAKVKQARVVGGGVINVVGRLSLELLMQDENTRVWHAVRETFNVIEGSPTFILGNTFHKPYRLDLDLHCELASYELRDGTVFTTGVSVHAAGAVSATSITADPLAYTTDSTTLSPFGFQTVTLKLPNTFAGQSVRLSRLPESDTSYASKAGIWVNQI